MLTSHRLRRLVATFSLALLCIVTQAPAFAHTEEANFIRLSAATADDAPNGVRGDLLLANDGNIYYMSSIGATGGAVGKLTPDGTLSTLHAFTSTAEGAAPYAGLMQASDGNLYGTTYLGGAKGAGTIFRVTLAGQYTLLQSLGATKTGPAFPYTGLVQASDGNLYGTSFRGGDNDKGTIFRIGLAGTSLDIIHSFTGADGENPEGTLIVGADGNLYGTTLQGGTGNRGTIYRVTTSGTVTTLYSFDSLSAFSSGVAVNATGANPRSRLLLAADGNYYGTAYKGGPIGYGTVFRMTPAGAVSVVYSFLGPAKGGAYPLAGVVQDSAGNFYGTTSGNADVDLNGVDLGSAWRINSSGQFSLLHSFIDIGSDGAQPHGALLLANGSIYGASFTDGTVNKGGIFKLDLGTGGVLPVELSVSPSALIVDFAVGIPATITWSSPGATTCTKSGAWATADTTTSGTQTVTVTQPAIYTYVLSCTDGAGVVRNAYTVLTASPPALEAVDGGGGTGAFSVWLLLLLAALLFKKYSRENFSACP